MTGLAAGTSYKASLWHDDANAADIETTAAFVTTGVVISAVEAAAYSASSITPRCDIAYPDMAILSIGASTPMDRLPDPTASEIVGETYASATAYGNDTGPGVTTTDFIGAAIAGSYSGDYRIAAVWFGWDELQ